MEHTTSSWLAARAGRRRFLLTAAAGLAGTAVLLAACGGSDDTSSPGEGEDVTLRFTWWGSDVRHQATQEMIDAFEAEHPNITIEPEFGEWSTYWDKLATQVAANDAPDIIQMDELYLREYAGRNALLDLSAEEALDTSAYDEATLATGEFDGGLYGLSAGVNSLSIFANQSIFDEAGVELPDDETWTWEEYAELAAEITDNTPDGVYGSAAFGQNESLFTIWARQHGESLYSENDIAFSPETLASFFEPTLAMQETGAVPPASSTVEDFTIALDQNLLATNKVAMGFAWSNQLHAYTEASGEEMVLLRMPSQTGSSTENGAFYKSSMFWSVSSRTEHPEEAAMFLDFIVNSQEAGEILLAERAVPPNGAIREAITDQLSEADAQAVAYIEDIADEIGDAPAPPPVGAADTQQVFQRYASEILFERMSPQDGAEGFADELSSNLASAG
ncbi:ABC transporter substrate-binding protein [Phytoactinopolyspora halotolerans]|uniref:Sugar ABC transporter substrate-binding protein n=1 Tax=Phytoactinopolyspora halotolerans TaxID=1981512 RepID=A0A6L9S9F3_9ACTN|nr:sugar ABC transporter substrate-binding protein [Phytoactinopolyspora halotolerans]NEE01856.1 sugar ABC transporter substrate-binding protein [Phytoactinopolyspora halotolerans]